MTKATYRKRVYWTLSVSEGESTTIMMGSMASVRQVGRHGTRVAAESSYLDQHT